jgi:hypothetical protein
MVQVHTCVSVHCDQCGQALGSPGFEAHYPTEDAALDAAEAADWVVGPAGRLWCSCCGPVLTCEAEGHEFTVWQPGSNAEGQLVGREYRYCRRCCLHESRAPTYLIGGIPGRGKSAAVRAALRSVAGAQVAGEVA